jgi:hypothetical protein
VYRDRNMARVNVAIPAQFIFHVRLDVAVASHDAASDVGLGRSPPARQDPIVRMMMPSRTIALTGINCRGLTPVKALRADHN